MTITWWMIPIGGLVGFITYMIYSFVRGIKQGIFSEEITTFKQARAEFKEDLTKAKIQCRKDWAKTQSKVERFYIFVNNFIMIAFLIIPGFISFIVLTLNCFTPFISDQILAYFLAYLGISLLITFFIGGFWRGVVMDFQEDSILLGKPIRWLWIFY